MSPSRLPFPGPELRGVPAFSIDAPEGFDALDVPESIGGFIEHGGAPPFSATLVIGWERLAATMALETVAEQTLADAQAAYEGYALERERTIVVDGLPAVARLQSFDEPRIDRRLAQLVVLVLLPAGPSGATRDLIHVTGSCLADDAATFLPRFDAAAESIEFAEEVA